MEHDLYVTCRQRDAPGGPDFSYRRRETGDGRLRIRRLYGLMIVDPWRWGSAAETFTAQHT
jgi:hypothetical protein